MTRVDGRFPLRRRALIAVVAASIVWSGIATRAAVAAPVQPATRAADASAGLPPLPAPPPACSRRGCPWGQGLRAVRRPARQGPAGWRSHSRRGRRPRSSPDRGGRRGRSPLRRRRRRPTAVLHARRTRRALSGRRRRGAGVERRHSARGRRAGDLLRRQPDRPGAVVPRRRRALGPGFGHRDRARCAAVQRPGERGRRWLYGVRKADKRLQQLTTTTPASPTGRWTGPVDVGRTWADAAIVGLGDGVLLGGDTSGDVRWYRHTGESAGQPTWAAGSGTVVATRFPRYAAVAPVDLGCGDYALPVDKSLLARAAYTRPHHDYPALDLPVPVGTAVHVIRAGRVASAGPSGLCGLGVIVEGTDGGRYVYCHLSRVDVAAGATLPTGSVLGLSGNTGHSTGPHLHVGLSSPDGAARCPQPLLLAVYDGAAVPAPSALTRHGCYYSHDAAAQLAPPSLRQVVRRDRSDEDPAAAGVIRSALLTKPVPGLTVISPPVPCVSYVTPPGHGASPRPRVRQAYRAAGGRPERRGGVVSRHDGGEGPRTGTDGVAAPAAPGRRARGAAAQGDQAARPAGRHPAAAHARGCPGRPGRGDLVLGASGDLPVRARAGARGAGRPLRPGGSRAAAARAGGARHRGRRDAHPARPRDGRQPCDLHRAQARASQARLRAGRDDQLLPRHERHPAGRARPGRRGRGPDRPDGLRADPRRRPQPRRADRAVLRAAARRPRAGPHPGHPGLTARRHAHGTAAAGEPVSAAAGPAATCTPNSRRRRPPAEPGSSPTGRTWTR